MWKELGADALEFLKSSAPSRVELPITQWSKILNPASLSDIELVQVRELANLAEKGDEKIWDRLQGKDVLLWAPSDNIALTRILAALLRRAGSDRRPTALRMIAPVPLLAGMNTVESITDLWWHPLLSEKWVPLVRGCSFSAYPFEIILLGPKGPRQDRAGLAIFNLALDGQRTLPEMIQFKAPLFTVESCIGMTVDMLACNLPSFLTAMQDPALVDVLCRQHRRSPLSSAETHRICLDLVFPAHHTELSQFLHLRHLRRVSLPATAFFGSKSMFGDPSAMILEINGPAGTHHYWPLCTQMVAVSASKLLVYTEAASNTWTETLDRVLPMDVTFAATRLT